MSDHRRIVALLSIADDARVGRSPGRRRWPSWSRRPGPSPGGALRGPRAIRRAARRERPDAARGVLTPRRDGAAGPGRRPDRRRRDDAVPARHPLLAPGERITGPDRGLPAGRASPPACTSPAPPIPRWPPCAWYGQTERDSSQSANITRAYMLTMASRVSLQLRAVERGLAWRVRDLGIAIGAGVPGAHNAITDVPGVRVGHTTLIEGSGPLVVGQGPVRTGVTVILPHDGNVWNDPLFAGYHALNGNGEMTGLAWIRESGLLTTPHRHHQHPQRGRGPRRADHATTIAEHGPVSRFWAYRWWRRPRTASSTTSTACTCAPNTSSPRMDAAAGGPVAEGCVGGGTGHDLPRLQGRHRHCLARAARRGRRLDGRRAGAGQLRPARALRSMACRSARRSAPRGAVAAPGACGEGAGSIIVIVATDAPLLPTMSRLAQRATLGIARMGGLGEQQRRHLPGLFHGQPRHAGRRATTPDPHHRHDPLQRATSPRSSTRWPRPPRRPSSTRSGRRDHDGPRRHHRLWP